MAAEEAKAVLSDNTLTMVRIVLSGVVGKLIVDQLKKLAKKLKMVSPEGKVNPVLIRGVTFPVVYLLLFGWSRLTGGDFSQDMVTAFVEAALASLATVGVSEWADR